MDLSHLTLNQSVHLSDIKLPEGVTITSRAHGGGDLAVATIKIVHEEVIEAPVVAAPVAGEAAAAAPGAAAPATGAAAPAAGADAKKGAPAAGAAAPAAGADAKKGAPAKKAEEGSQVRPSGSALMAQGISLLVGLGNSGTEYAETRYNAGFRFLDALLVGTGVSSSNETAFPRRGRPVRRCRPGSLAARKRPS